MLKRQGRSIFQNPGRFNGAIAVTSVTGNAFKGGGKNRYFGAFSQVFGALPSGNIAPSAFIMPIKSGAISSYTLSNGVITPNVDLIPAYNLEASASASITVTNAQLDQIVSAVANGTATISVVNAILAGAATLQANGTLTLTSNADAGAIFSVTADANGVISANVTISALANMEAEAGGPTPLSPEGLAQAVWDSVAVDNNEVGTMGNKLNTASSGGVDVESIAVAVWDKPLSEHTAVGTFGWFVQKVLTVSKFLGLK